MACESRNLAQMKAGQQAVITRIKVPEPLATRLTALGVLVGTRVSCLGTGPFGDPIAYEIRRAVIALRQSDGCGIEVR